MTDARAVLATFATGFQPREIDDDILDLTTSPTRAHYDLTARAYDMFVGLTVWHRALWRTTPAAFRAFAASIYDARSEGPHVELGCGSLLFTADLYDADRGRPVILIDQSIEMLRLTRSP